MEGTNAPIGEKDDIFVQMEKQADTGEKIVKAIVITSYILLVFDLILSFVGHTFGLLTVIKLILWAIVYYKLYQGRTWAKWLYIISIVIGTILVFVQYWNSFGIIFSVVSQAQYLLLAIVLWVAIAASITQIVFCFLLLFSESVKEFLYRQSTTNW